MGHKLKILLITTLMMGQLWNVYAGQGEDSLVEYHLSIAEEKVNITGKSVKAMTINGGIPGPVLHFTEGDLARIHVKNEMDVETSIHWHGLLLPPEMDGVPFISFPPIQPGETFTYEFPIRQSGTYWYHSHTMLQEQRGVYGSIVIEPESNPLNYDQDHVILLSDWTNTDPHKVLRTLKRGSEWFSIQKGTAQSLLGAIRLGMIGDYLKREFLRMPAMDLSDIAYDRFLVNGKPVLKLEAKGGEKVRLRIINGSASTFFYVEFAGGEMTIISADGQDVEPTTKKRFLIGVAETYDVLVTLPADGAYEFRSTSHDGSAFSTVWLGSGEKYAVSKMPAPNLYSFMGDMSPSRIFALTPGGTMGMSSRAVHQGLLDSPGMHGMGETPSHVGMASMDIKNNEKRHSMPMKDKMDSMKGHGLHQGHNMPSMDMSMQDVVNTYPKLDKKAYVGNRYGFNFMPFASDVSSSKELAMEGMGEERPGVPYEELRAVEKTSFDARKSRHDIRLTLDGDMERFIWKINGKTLSSKDVIRIKEGEIVRFIMINRTMMHHPMHLHGHFFRVINKQGDYSPLKHTVDVEPMTTTIIEFNANEKGDWFFHCHLLYHMEDGMARVVEYEDFTPSPEVQSIRSELYKSMWYFYGQADGLSNMSSGMLNYANSRYMISTAWEYGWQNIDGSELEVTPTASYYINRFFSVFAGADIIAALGPEDKVENARGIIGFDYRLPLNIESRVWIDSGGGARLTLGKKIKLTPRLSAFGEVEYDTRRLWEGNAGLAYQVNQNVSLIGKWHFDYGWGGGLRVEF